MNLDQIEDMVNRYRTRAYRMAVGSPRGGSQKQYQQSNSKSSEINAKLKNVARLNS